MIDLASFTTGAILTGAAVASVGTLVHTIRTSTDRIVAALQKVTPAVRDTIDPASTPEATASIDSAVLPAAILTAAFAIHTHRMSTEGPAWGNAPFLHFLEQIRRVPDRAPVAEAASHP